MCGVHFDPDKWSIDLDHLEQEPWEDVIPLPDSSEEPESDPIPAPPSTEAPKPTEQEAERQPA